MVVSVSIKGTYILILGCCAIYSATCTDLYPTTVAQVCHIGDQLELTCNTNGTFIRWDFMAYNGLGRPQNYERNINSQDRSQQVSTVTLNSTTFTFMRSSTQGMTPLVSTLVISSVSIALNETIIHCIDASTSLMASTTIQILGVTQEYYALEPILGIDTVNYGADNITIAITWTKEVGVLYNVYIIPLAPIILNNGSISSVQLTLQYNTEYILSVSAAAPCINNATSLIVLNYVSCGNPLATVNDSTLRIVDYSGVLTLEGTTVNFSCPTGLIINGTKQSTCMSDGRWEPDPKESVCIETFSCGPPSSPSNGYIDSYNLTEGGLTVIFVCQNNNSCLKGLPGSPKVSYTVVAVCTLDGNWDPNLDEFCSMTSLSEIAKSSSNGNVLTVMVATSVAVLLTSNVIIFILGFVCGHCCSLTKHKNTTEGTTDLQTGEILQPHQDFQPPTIYENIELETETMTVEEQDPEISTNVAYGHLHMCQ